MSKREDAEHAFDVGGVAALVSAIQAFELIPTMTKEEMLDSLRGMIDELDPGGEMRAEMHIRKDNSDPLLNLLKAIFQ